MKQKASLLVKSLFGVMTFALLAPVATTTARADAYGPALDLTKPNDGQQVVSLKKGDTSTSYANYIVGLAQDPDGINRVTIVIKRLSDSAYWTGNNWISGSIGFAARLDFMPEPAGTEPRAHAYFDVPNGPPAAGITAGVNYLIQVEAVDLVGNRTLKSITIVGVD
ncbi:MAG: hypothetical protein EOO38_15575 [Cytophagaceae bacterium]|nr:MAG: hypothetical protein EOO38_15575 [Cytophagaceae bacterium]